MNISCRQCEGPIKPWHPDFEPLPEVMPFPDNWSRTPFPGPCTPWMVNQPVDASVGPASPAQLQYSVKSVGNPWEWKRCAKSQNAQQRKELREWRTGAVSEPRPRITGRITGKKYIRSVPVNNCLCIMCPTNARPVLKSLSTPLPRSTVIKWFTDMTFTSYRIATVEVEYLFKSFRPRCKAEKNPTSERYLKASLYDAVIFYFARKILSPGSSPSGGNRHEWHAVSSDK